MPRSTVVAVYLLALVAVAAGLIMIAFPRDTSWLMAALVPIAMLGVFVVTVGTPQETTPPLDKQWRRSVTAQQHGPYTGRATADPDAGRQTEGQFPQGVWSGTLRLRSADGRDALSLVPISMALGTNPIQARLLPTEASVCPERVVAVDLVEYDRQRNVVYLRIAVQRQGPARPREFTTKLVLQDHALLPEDDTELATLELNRTSPSAPRTAACHPVSP